MININLLPPHLRPIKRTPLPYLVCALVFVLVLLACGAVFVNNQARIAGLRNAVAEQQEALAQLQPYVDEYNSLTEGKELLKGKIQAISEIVSDRIIWSEQLAKLADFAPPNFWYDEIYVELRTFNEVKKQFNAQTKKEEEVKVVVKRPILVVEGYVIDDEQGRRSVNPLTFVTQEDEAFSKTFRFLSPAIEDTVFDGYPVRKFSLEYSINAGGRQE